MYTIPDLKAMIGDHLTTGHTPTHFSSWAADLAVALNYAGFGTYNRSKTSCISSRIAVIDTSLLNAHVEVNHTFDMQQAGLTPISYDYEWLAYGPIEGKAFRCVSIKRILEVGLEHIFDPHRPLPQSDEYETPALATPEAITKAASEIGHLFRYEGDEHSDMVLAVTAAILGVHYTRQGISRCNPEIIDMTVTCLSEELMTVRPPKQQGLGICLTNPLTSDRRKGTEQFITDLLIAWGQYADQIAKDTKSL